MKATLQALAMTAIIIGLIIGAAYLLIHNPKILVCIIGIIIAVMVFFKFREEFED
jgi:uncharacterized membrane protein